MPNKNSATNYGMDALGIIKGFIVAGSLLLVFASALLLWHASNVVMVIGWTILITSFIPLILGSSMIAYGTTGKMRTRDLMLNSVPWTGSEKVLDIGTGAGLLAIGAAKRAARGAVIGVDIWSEKDLSNNRQEVTLHNVAIEGVSDRVTIQSGDARSLPFATDSFDRVVSLLCLHNIEDKKDQAAACVEIARMLKPGGFAMIADYLPTSGYAEAFKTAGLKIIQEKTAFTTALALMWIVIAEKPVVKGNS